jgi:hypothetical protein
VPRASLAKPCTACSISMTKKVVPLFLVPVKFHIRTHSYEYMYIHSIFMSNFKRLTQFNLEIYEVGQRVSHCRWGRQLPQKKIINYKSVI